VLVAEKAPVHFEEIGKGVGKKDFKERADTMSKEERLAEIMVAVGKLDKNNKELWTGDGKLKVEAVEQAVRFVTTRKEVEDALRLQSQTDLL
jgi:hypothetical protein